MTSHYYKGFVMKKLYNQYVIKELGGFATIKEAREYIDTIKRKEKRKETLYWINHIKVYKNI